MLPITSLSALDTRTNHGMMLGGQNHLGDLYTKREFRELENNPKFSSPYWIPSDRLSFSAIQHFAARLMNEKTTIKRMILNLGTGVGKTVTATNIAMTFVSTSINL